MIGATCDNLHFLNLHLHETFHNHLPRAFGYLDARCQLEGVASLCHPSGGKVGGLSSHCAWPAKHVDSVSLPSGRPARVGWRKLARPGGYGDEQRLRLETEQGKSSSVHSGGTARLSGDQCPLRGPRWQNSQPFLSKMATFELVRPC